MATSINQVILIGVVERAVEVRYFGHGHVHALLTLKTRETIPTIQDPTRIIETRHRISGWGEMALQLEREVRLGATIRILGRLSYEREQSISGAEQVWATVVCSDLEVIQDVCDTTADTPLAPAAPEIDWETFAPEEGEDPMA